MLKISVSSVLVLPFFFKLVEQVWLRMPLIIFDVVSRNSLTQGSHLLVLELHSLKTWQVSKSVLTAVNTLCCGKSTLQDTSDSSLMWLYSMIWSLFYFLTFFQKHILYICFDFNNNFFVCVWVKVNNFQFYVRIMFGKNMNY